MPFQGNPNAGNVDPGLLGLLFQERSRRREAERQAEIDAQKARMEAYKFQLEQDRADRKEAREEEAHRAKMAADQDKLFRSQNKGISQGEAVERATPQAAHDAVFNDRMLGATANNPILRANAMPTADNRHLQALSAWALNNADQVGALSAQVTPESVSGLQSGIASLPTSPLYAQELARISKLRGIPISDLRFQGALLSNAGEVAEVKEFEKAGREKQRDANIEFDKQNRLNAASAYRDDALAISRLSRTADRFIADANKARAEAEKYPLGDPKRAAALRRASVAEGQLNRLVNENVSPDHFKNMTQFMHNNLSLLQETESAITDLQSFAELAKANPNFLGSTRGGLTRFLSVLSEGASDVLGVANVPGGEMLSSIAAASRDLLVRDAALTPDQRVKLEKDMGFTLDEEGTLQAQTDAAALSSRIAFIITRVRNPDRFSTSQYEENRRLYSLDKSSGAQSLRNLNLAIAELTNARDIVQQRTSAILQLAPGEFGGLESREGETVFPPAPGTPFSSTGGAVTVDPSALETEQRVSGAAPIPKTAKDFRKASPEEKQRAVEEILRKRGLR